MNWKILLIGLSFFFCEKLNAQPGNPIPPAKVKSIDFSIHLPPDSFLMNLINKDSVTLSMSADEKEVLYWTNFLRRNPSLFYQQVIIPYLDINKNLKGEYTTSLEQEMAALSPLSLLFPKTLLNHSAFELANNIAVNHLSLSHQGSTGKTFEQRMQEAHTKGCAEENIFEGTASPLEMIVLLLIDYGNKNLGHRENLLNPLINFVGISIRLSGQHKKILVQDMTCE